MLTVAIGAALLALAVVVLALFAAEQRGARANPISEQPLGPAWITRTIPRERSSARAVAVGASCLLTLVIAGLGVYWGLRYALALFVITPVAVGLLTSLVLAYHREPALGECLSIASLAIAASGACFLFLAIEGIVCLLMALPLAVPMSMVGACIGFLLQRRWRRSLPATLGMVLVITPLVTLGESIVPSAMPSFVVRTTIEINAPADVVWNNLVEFAPIPGEPQTWFFRAGISYPISASLQGTGAGATRICEFSTGRFIEIIDTWNPGRELSFTVVEQPPPLREWTPYRDIHPPHLEGFFLPRSASFTLTGLPGGRTRLEGASLYQHSLAPSGYWQLWSEMIVRRVHHRVFDHIRRNAETIAVSGR